MTQPYKVCPRCQTPADLQAAACASCGRQYRTQFVPPINQTQVVHPAPAPFGGNQAADPFSRYVQRRPWLMAAITIAFIAVFSFLAWTTFAQLHQGIPGLPTMFPATATHKLWYYESNTVPMGQTLADLKENALAGPHIGYAGDADRLLELRSSGRVYMTEKETQVVLLGADGDYVNVRLCSGHHSGQTGWTRKEGLHELNEPVAPSPVPQEYRQFAPHGVG